MENKLITAISLISFILSFILIGFCYKYVEKCLNKEDNKEIIVKKIKIALIFVIPSILLAVSTFILLILTMVNIITVIRNVYYDTSSFKIDEVYAYIIILITSIISYFGVNIIYNYFFIKENSKLYLWYHKKFKYFYFDSTGLNYNTKVHKFWFVFLIRIIFPLFIVCFVSSLLII